MISNFLDAVRAADGDALTLEQVGVRRRVEQEGLELPIEVAVGGHQQLRGDCRHRR
jgi:hypothetical protein